MGKTKSHMYTGDDNRSLITLKIHGPRSLINGSEPITVEVKVNSTWAALLNDQLKLKVPLDQGIYICNPSKTNKGSRWRTELDEQVCHYVNRYRHNRDTYTASIRHPDIKKYRQREKAAGKLKRLRSKSTTDMPPPPPPPPAVPSTSRGIMASHVQDIPTPQSSVVSWIPKIGNVRSVLKEENGERVIGWDLGEIEIEVDGGFGGRADEEMSVVTTASQQVEELIRHGIRNEDINDIKTHAARQLDEIGNNMCLLVRHEMQQLIEGKRWEKIVERAPRVAYFVGQLFGGRV